MKTISNTEYENETNPYELKNKLIDIGLLNVYFVKAAIYAAKSVQHLVVAPNKEVSLSAIETAEKYLSGQATIEECKEAYCAAHAAATDYATDSAAYAAYRAADTAYYAGRAVESRSAAQTAADFARAVVAYDYWVADNAACVISAAGVYATITEATACDIFRKLIPWNLVCATQIAKCFGKEKDENFIQNIMKDEKLINYATILIEDKNLKKQFHFFMKDYMNK